MLVDNPVLTPLTAPIVLTILQRQEMATARMLLGRNRQDRDLATQNINKGFPSRKPFTL